MLGIVSLLVGGGIELACWGWSVCKLEGVLSLHVGMVNLQVGRGTEFACWDGQFASWKEY